MLWSGITWGCAVCKEGIGISPLWIAGCRTNVQAIFYQMKKEKETRPSRPQNWISIFFFWKTLTLVILYWSLTWVNTFTVTLLMHWIRIIYAYVCGHVYKPCIQTISKRQRKREREKRKNSIYQGLILQKPLYFEAMLMQLLYKLWLPSQDIGPALQWGIFIEINGHSVHTHFKGLIFVASFLRQLMKLCV